VDAQHVRYFLAVIDHGSINAAATAVGVAQPTISQALRSLERELKTPLFHRIGRGMVPTSAGYALVGPGRKILRDITTAAGSVPDAEGRLRGRLDVRAHPAVSTGLLPRLVTEFHRRHPKVQVSVLPLYDEGAVAALVHDAECDVVVVHLPLEDDSAGLEVLELGTQVYDVALPPGSEETPDRSLRWDELTGAMVVVPHGTSHAAQLYRAMSPEQQRRRPAVVLQNREARLAFTLAGVGPTWVERSATEVAKERGALIRRMEPPLPRPFGLAYDAGTLSPVARAFVETATEIAARATAEAGAQTAAGVDGSGDASAARNAAPAGES